MRCVYRKTVWIASLCSQSNLLQPPRKTGVIRIYVDNFIGPVSSTGLPWWKKLCVLCGSKSCKRIIFWIARTAACNDGERRISLYPTTTFTIRSGTTMTLRTSLPSIDRLTSSLAMAICSVVFLSEPFGNVIVARTLPLT